MKFKLFIIFVLICLSCPAWAATYYVKNGGNDSLDGLSDSTAWATVARVASTVRSGDTVYFRSQDTWEFSTAPFLTATAGVTYYGYTYGSGTRAKFKAVAGINNATAPLIRINASDVGFVGFEIDGNSLGAAGGGVYVGYGAAGAIDNVTVKDCYIHHIGNPTLVGGTHSITDPNILSQAWAPNWQYGLYAAGGTDNATHTNFYIIGNEVAYTYHEGIAIYTAWVRTNPKVNGVTVRGNTVHHCGTRPTYRSASGTFTNGGQGILVANDADNVVVEFNYVHHNGANNVWFRTSPESATGAPNGLVIRYNLISYAGASGLTDQNAQNLNIDASIYGNIFINNGTSEDDYGYDIKLTNDTSTSTINIYNNTIYNTTNTNPFQATVAINPYSGGEARANYVINFKNNIIYTSSSFKPIYDRFGELVTSNNLIYRVGGSTLVSVGATNYTSADLDDWDANAQTADPAFTGGTLPTGFSGTYGSNMVPNTDYFQLTVDSPAKDTGATLEGYTGSINGAGLTTPIVRPLGAAFDIGAYEYGTVAQSGGSAGSGFKMQGVTIR